jgi:hypothetical protein
MGLADVPRLISPAVLAAALGCAATTPQAPLSSCSEPPHSRFHPVPTKPVFEGAVVSLPVDARLAPHMEPLTPELPPPAPPDEQPELLPEFSSKPISFQRPSLRRKG